MVQCFHENFPLGNGITEKWLHAKRKGEGSWNIRQTVAVSWGKGSNFVNVTSCSSEIVQGVLWKNRAKTS